MFILQHHLQHSIIGFRMSSKIPFLTLDTGEALWKKIFPMENNSEDQAKSFEDKCAFFSFFHFLSDYFDMDSRDFDFEILRNKAT